LGSLELGGLYDVIDMAYVQDLIPEFREFIALGEGQ
jgi:hypothetical protein